MSAAAGLEPTWTCERCRMTAHFAPGHAPESAPAGWAEIAGDQYCLNCRRGRAGDEAVESAPEGTVAERRAQLRKEGVIDFEIRRDPERSNGMIAAALHTSVPAVAKARGRLASERSLES